MMSGLSLKGVFLLLLLFATGYGAFGQRVKLDMNTAWGFYRGDLSREEAAQSPDAEWMPVALPHIMQLEKKHCGGNSIYDGVGWYRRYFTLDAKYRGKRVAISFEGVMTGCEIFLNGCKVGEHHGGYLGFTVDVSDRVRWDGNNLLTVRVSAAPDPLTPPGKPQDKMDFYYYSGIYRDVSMIITDRLHVTDALQEPVTAGGGVFVRYPRVSERQAEIAVRTHVRNARGVAAGFKVLTTLLDAENRVVARGEQTVSLPSSSARQLEQSLVLDRPQLWHPYSPYLYTLQTRLVDENGVVDCVEEKIGVRTVEFSTDKGFSINGRHLYLRGANRHQAYPHVGDAASNSMQEREVIALKRGGFNAVRAAHYPHDPAFLEACDRYGLLVVECIPGWQFFNSDTTFVRRLYDVGRGMIRRDRNHPSVVLWETALNESRYPVSVARDLFEIAHAEYPGDQMYTAGDYFGHADMEPYYDVFYKQVARFPRDGDVMSNYPEDFLAVKPLMTREWGDGVGEKPRVSLRENEEEQMRQCRSRMKQLNGEGYFDWCMLDANPHMAGHFVWSYNDYARGSQDETMYSGVVDMNRYPKFSYYMLQSMRDPAISQKGLYEGPMVFIASYNASAEYLSSTGGIMVFSNCDEVRLYRNGRCIGVQTREERAPLYAHVVDKGGSPLFVFDGGGYEAGTLSAEGYIGGKCVARHRVATPLGADHIEVRIATEGIDPVADGSDMIPVYFSVCDREGNPVTDADTPIRIEVEGEGVLIGDGIPRVEINPQRVEGGVGFAFVRTTRRGGKIVVRAHAEGLKSGRAVVHSRRFSGEMLPDGRHEAYEGHEEDHVVVKPSSWQKRILERPRLEIASVTASGEQAGYPASNIIDGNDGSWWIAAGEECPQVVTIMLKELTYVAACRIVFQKDSSSYRHRVETSEDGVKWQTLYRRECTGWEFKPMTVDREMKYLRVVVEEVSEGRAGLGEISLY